MKRLFALTLAVLMILSSVVVLASCTDSGTEITTETGTEATTETGTETEAHEHAFGEWEITTNATCTTDGLTERVCACGEKETQVIQATGHTEAIDAAKEPTCGAVGMTEGKHCSVCEEVLVPQEEVPATGLHTYGEQPTYASDENGSTCEVCATCGYLKALTKDETIRLIYESMPEFRQEVVAFSCPEANEAEYYEQIFLRMQEAGITATVSGDQTLGTSIGELLEACEKIDFGVYIQMHGMSAIEMVYKLYATTYYVEETDEEVPYSCIRGVYLKDEPVPIMFPGLAEAKQMILDTFDYAENWLIGANLLPQGDSAYAQNWYDTAVEYIETVKADYICFDRYPWKSTGEVDGSPEKYVSNLMLAKKAADKYDIPMFTYIQTTGLGGSGIHPTFDQLRCEIHLSLACGADALFLFTVYEGHGYAGMISNHGNNVNSMYYYLQDVMTEVNAMKGIYDQFQFEKVMTLNCPEYDLALSNSGLGDYLTDTYGKLGDVSATNDGKCFIGCMKDELGRDGFYVVNPDYTGEDAPTYTLTFTEETTYQIWNYDGLSDIGTASSLTLDLQSGQGVFVVLGGDHLPQ